MNNILIKNGVVIDPSQNINKKLDVLIKGNKISAIEENIKEQADDITIIDASGLYVCPGLIDMHVHLRDPGQTHKEDIVSGCDAASKGGFTSLACMPNTTPPIDSTETIQYIINSAKQAKIKVYPIACVTKGMLGKEITDIEELKNAGAIALSDDGNPVSSNDIMDQAMALSKKYKLPIISHCEDKSISKNGIINKGEVSKELNLPGIDSFSEDSITSREICLSSKHDCPIHIAHVSTSGSTKMINTAKTKGTKVTAETCPHYFCLTDQLLKSKDANYRMNPPLRTEQDRQAIIAGIANDTFDCIVTDHAPHTEIEKKDFENAPNGIIGLETSLALCLTHLVEKDIISISKLVKLMSLNPAKILSIPGGTLKPNSPADIVLIDINKEWVVDKNNLLSKSKNTPFHNMKLKGKAVCTICDGSIVYNEM